MFTDLYDFFYPFLYFGFLIDLTIKGVIPWAIKQLATNKTQCSIMKMTTHFITFFFHISDSRVKRARQVCVSDHLSSPLAITMFLRPPITTCSITPVNFGPLLS